jgi:hypothetical protein
LGLSWSVGDTDGALTLVALALAPVDEPPSWALLVVGVPLIGWLARRRARQPH